MTRTHQWTLLFLVVFCLTLACSLTPTPAPAPTATEDQQAIIETSVAATVAAQPTDAPAQATATGAPVVVPTDTLAPTAEPTAEPTPEDISAPDPLGPGYTGLIFDFGSCYDFDTYQPAPEGDASVDACLDQYGTLSFYNGARMSGSATFDAPTRNECIASALEPNNLAPNSDLYLCLQTSEGSYGFFVERDFQLELNRFTFDLYIFP